MLSVRNYKTSPEQNKASPQQSYLSNKCPNTYSCRICNCTQDIEHRSHKYFTYLNKIYFYWPITHYNI